MILLRRFHNHAQPPQNGHNFGILRAQAQLEEEVTINQIEERNGVRPSSLTPPSLGAETQNRTGDTRIFSHDP
jgi:hypothetical protein